MGKKVKCAECKEMKDEELVLKARQRGNLNKVRNVCIDCLCGE